MGYEGRTASSTVPDEAVPRVRASGGRVKPGSKPRAATEERVPRRKTTADGAGATASQAEPASDASAGTVVLIPEAPPPDGTGDGAVRAPTTEADSAPEVDGPAIAA